MATHSSILAWRIPGTGEPLRPLRGLQETRVATREESGVLGFSLRRGLTPRGSLECNPDKNTGVGCHFLLQCMKVKSESEVAQSCPTLRDPMDCSPPGSSVHGILGEDYWNVRGQRKSLRSCGHHNHILGWLKAWITLFGQPVSVKPQTWLVALPNQ